MRTNNSTLKTLGLPVFAITLLIVMVAWMAGAFKDKVTPGIAAHPIPENLTLLREQAFIVSLLESDAYEPIAAGVEAKQNSVISSRILAKIEEVHVRAGQIVKKGQLLLELEDDDLRSRESQAKAALSSIGARLAEAENNLNRANELSNKGILAKASLEQAQANYDSLLAERDRAEQALSGAKTALAYTRILSPIDGLVIDRFAEPGSTAQPGVQLLTLYNPSALRVEANVREQLAVGLELGDVLSVYIPSLDKELSSQIEEIVPAGNTASRTFLIKASLQAEGLMPGMYAQLSVLAGKTNRLMIPRDRVSELGQLNVVWLLEGDVISRRFIRTGDHNQNGMVEVISGLKSGDLVLPRQN